MANYKCFQNKDCEYFPCHRVVNSDKFNCLFCFCPLYPLGDKCGGNFSYTEQGVKDCSHCLIPHAVENYEKIMEKMPLVMELVAKRDDP